MGKITKKLYGEIPFFYELLNEPTNDIVSLHLKKKLGRVAPKGLKKNIFVYCQKIRMNRNQFTHFSNFFITDWEDNNFVTYFCASLYIQYIIFLSIILFTFITICSDALQIILFIYLIQKALNEQQFKQNIFSHNFLIILIK